MAAIGVAVDGDGDRWAEVDTGGKKAFNPGL
jgi:phosphomannomutase